jgi:hypothetical protein
MDECAKPDARDDCNAPAQRLNRHGERVHSGRGAGVGGGTRGEGKTMAAGHGRPQARQHIPSALRALQEDEACASFRF